MAKWGFFVFALDASSEAVELTHKRCFEEGVKRLVHAQMYTAPKAIALPAESAQLAIDVQTVQHLTEEQHEAMYKEVARVLVPGGLFFSVHWVAGGTAERIFPDHPELAAMNGEFPLGSLITEAGFTLDSYEILSRTYGNDLAQWAVVVGRKI